MGNNLREISYPVNRKIAIGGENCAAVVSGGLKSLTNQEK
jgi:hypothetical protein